MIYVLVFIAFAILIIITKTLNKKPYNEKFAINDAILNHEELMIHAKVVAKSHVISKRKKNYDFLFSRLDENYKFISTVYKKLNDNARKQISLCPASEWILDNFYIIEEQYKNLKLNIGGNFFKNLNIIDKGPLKGYPRIFAIGLELISHTDGRIDMNQFIQFVDSYQSVNLLSMAEIWALFPMIRISILEKIRFVCEKIEHTQTEWENVDKFQFISVEALISESIKYINDMKVLDSSYVEHLLTVLKKEDVNQEDVLNTIINKLIEFDSDIDKVINFEHQEQASLQITMGNCITSLRLVNSLDWEEIFEKLSMVENILRSDPAKIYSTQDFESRDYYRHVIEIMAKKYKISETKIARKAILCAKNAVAGDNELKLSHIGYYIIGEGKIKLLSLLSNNKPRIHNKSHSYYKYIFLMCLISTLIPISFIFYTYLSLTKPNLFLVLLVGFIFWIPSSEIVINLSNKLITKVFNTSFLPKIEYTDGIPGLASTIVIVPTLINSPKRAVELINQLEVTYLANNEENIFFALVGDFKDSIHKITENDTNIIDISLPMIKALNEKYSPEKDIFYFFMRERTFIKEKGNWMGYERKRGAIVEFNDFIKGKENTTYKVISSDIELLKNIKYVITLDADTIMPIGSASKLIGTISHPLNRAHFDEQKSIVTDGYGLIQPRIGLNINSSNKSLFSRIFAGQGGIDSYTNAISDVYQDLFGEGIFTGKGIYDIDIFRKALNMSIPDNTILSHDLLEGSYLRVGLATDIELIDNYPERYSSYIIRLHRWVRGDWQLIKWFLPTLKNKNGEKVKNPISALSKWKIFDNLRRSLVSLCLMGIFIMSILVLPINISLYLGFAFLTIFLPLITSFFQYVKLTNYSKGRERLNGNLIYGIKSIFFETLLVLIFLPYHSYMMGNAILKTLFRVFITKSNMLEWITAADVEKNTKNDLPSYIKRMAPIIAILYTLPVLALIFNPRNIIYSLLLVIIWSTSPFIAYYISITDKPEVQHLSDEDINILRCISRKTWYFYETFAGPDDNYLPPDNYQTTPIKRIAHRTSPTNLGFLLISILSAKDLGYITIPTMLRKLAYTMESLRKMEKWNGHFYNWYDTKTLNVLSPRYISTVDSGNLVGYLITLKQGLDEQLNLPLINSTLALGFIDTLCLYDEKNPTPRKMIEQFVATNSYDPEIWYEFTISLINCLMEDNSYYGVTLRDAKILKDEIETYFSYVTLNEGIHKIINESKLSTSFKNMLDTINSNSSIINILIAYNKILKDIENLLSSKNKTDKENEFLRSVKNVIQTSNVNTKNLMDDIDSLKSKANELVVSTSFTKLYDEKVGLFSIGYNIDENRLTNSYYDLLASEARIASYIAVARREIPVTHWFKLGRALALIDRYKALVSWTGTMFEYFMPPLIMKVYDNTLLDETYKTVMRAQIKYGKQRNVPWGTSESGFYTFDLMLNYQYKAFGVPELGLKRGLINDMVVSPYSTILGLPFSPKECAQNIRALINSNVEGEFGLYEAVDYTPDRLPENSKGGIVESFMAHHQGMTLIALNNFFNNNIMVSRFHSEPIIKAGEFLLQERIPLRVLITKEHKELIEPLEKIEYMIPTVIRRYKNLDSDLPNCHILSNGSYTTMITNRGSGYSKKDDIYVTRFREDITSRNFGFFILLREVSSSNYWSSTFEPLNVAPDRYEAKFSPDKAEFFRTDGYIDTHTEICVSPEDNCEIRRVTLTNNSSNSIIIECTSYFETVLVNRMTDIVHPAFSNLFIRTEAFKEYNSLIASRRSREESGKAAFAFHTINSPESFIGDLEYETDRSKFIGRGNNITNCLALSHPLSNTAGAVLDPIMSLRRRIKIEPNRSAAICYIAGVSDSKESSIELSKKYNEYSNILRAFELAYIRSQMSSKYLNLKNSDIECFENMISSIIFLSPQRRKYEEYLLKNKRGQSVLWNYGISGDLPIITVSIKNADDIDVIKDIVKAHEYWKTRGLKLDCIILFEEDNDYLQPLQNLVKEIILSGNSRDVLDSSGGIFIKNSKLIPMEDKVLFFAHARIIIKAELGNLKFQTKYQHLELAIPDRKVFSGVNVNYTHSDEPLNLVFFNDYGGFNPDGSEYIIRLKANTNTPAPWINVIANKKFGFLVTESGSGYTWSGNSRENKLTEWTNDPISDTPSEIIYIRNEDTGEAWNIVPLPIREKESYKITHGMGYSTFEHFSHGIEQTLSIFVPISDEAVKISRVKLKNTTDKIQELCVFYYMKPVLGVSDQVTQPFIITDYLENTDILIIKNPYSPDYSDKLTFVDSSLKKDSVTGDRQEFIGNNGNLQFPEALNHIALSGRLGGGYYPCIAIQSTIKLLPNEEIEFTILLGEGQSPEDIQTLSQKYRDLLICDEELSRAKLFWKRLLGTIQIKTPELSMDIMMNSWLLYQTTVCRIWARSAFYQSGGAYGFRDQLQDVLSLINILPGEAKNQILLHCAHQFVEGDVQHWWHPGPFDKGIRTKFSDDLLWLPYVASEYVEKTGDIALLEEVVTFIEDAPLKEHEDERYGIPQKSEEKASVYEHCIRAIEKALKFGEHGLPLMGSGDWNDGMNTVGNKGKGESVWMGWFLCSVLTRFSPLCKIMNDEERSENYMNIASKISSFIEENAWDGQWYRRAYFDDGTPLGSSSNNECKIDSLAQSWAIISGYGDKTRAITAMQSLEDYLIHRDDGLILLFTPPFDSGDLKPGYIKGYVPGVRENGGQYTHAATWVIYAFAKMGNGDKALDCFKLINPITHAMTQFECARYKVEPYVVAADVYAVNPHTGRGGWTWYTGSSGWMYKVGLEEILGFKKKANILTIQPCIPHDWTEYSIKYTYLTSTYNITIKNPHNVNTGVKQVFINGIEAPNKNIELLDTGFQYNVEIILG